MMGKKGGGWGGYRHDLRHMIEGTVSIEEKKDFS